MAGLLFFFTYFSTTRTHRFDESSNYLIGDVFFKDSDIGSFFLTLNLWKGLNLLMIF